MPERIAAGTLRPAYLKVDGGMKRMPFPSAGKTDALRTASTAGSDSQSARTSPGIAVKSVGCAERNRGQNVRVNQDCTYRRRDRIRGENNPPPGGFGPEVANKMSDYVLSGGTALNTPYRFEVLSPRFPPPDGIQGGFNGDYSGIAVDRNNVAHPIWSDTRNRVPNPAFNKVGVDEDVFTVSRPVPGSQR